MLSSLDIAISPCPNDTFAFGAWVTGKLSEEIPKTHCHDIEELNLFAKRGQYTLTKMSAYCYAAVQHIYDLLPVGAALGTASGPKLVSKTTHSSIEQGIIAHPGEHTTAYALLRILYPDAQHLVAMRYDTILEAVSKGHVDAGVIIHESRFVFKEMGLIERDDLGTSYYNRTGMPLPLGVLGLKKCVPKTVQEEIIRIIGKSIDYAEKKRQVIMPYIRDRAQEMDEKVIESHINLFVTEETRALTLQGRAAILHFLNLTRDIS